MAQITTNEVRGGMKVEVENEPYDVISNEFVKPGKGQPFNRIKLKHLKTNRVIEKTYKSGDKLELADVEERNMRLLYRDQNNAVFMDDETYDQIEVPLHLVEGIRQWLKDEVLYDIVFYKGEVIEVIPPTFMEMTIIETIQGERGDTSGRVLKPATTDTGAKIQIPLFIDQDEKIKVDTRTGEYVSRVK